MAIYLIRHGETAGNATRVVQVPEIPLSPNGIHQARRLARRLAGEGIGQILSSDLARAAMTAEAVAETTGAPIRYDALLHERNFGDVRGTPYAELSVDLFAPDYDPPGGEIVRDESGAPTGMLLETAEELVHGAIPKPDLVTYVAALKKNSFLALSRRMTAAPLTSRRSCTSFVIKSKSSSSR